MKMMNDINDGNNIIQACIVGLVGARLCSKGFKHLDSFDPIIIPVLQTNKLRLGQVKSLTCL